MKRYYNVRILHNPINRQYTIELKQHWYSFWEKIDSIAYSPEKDRSHRFYTSQEDAFSIARKWANSLVEEQIIYQERK